jgi:hypothetical protein
MLLVFSDSSHAFTELQTPPGWASAFDVPINLINSTMFFKRTSWSCASGTIAILAWM